MGAYLSGMPGRRQATSSGELVRLSGVCKHYGQGMQRTD